MRAGGRGGVGILAIVLVVLLLMVIIAFTSAFGRSSTSRTVLRITDIRSAFECGESALAEAVVILRENLDSGRTTPECADDWRSVIAQALEAPTAAFATRKIVPRRTRTTFQLPHLSSNVGDVSVHLVEVQTPEAQPGGLTPPPQGVLEMSVTVEVHRMTSRVRKTVRQRRCFFLSWPGELPGSGDAGSPTTQVTLVANPLGTVVE